jgi:hypothetical protein
MWCQFDELSEPIISTISEAVAESVVAMISANGAVRLELNCLG